MLSISPLDEVAARFELARFTTNPYGYSQTYSGSSMVLCYPGVATGGTIYYSTSSANGSWSTAVPTGISTGTYTIYAKVVGDACHLDSDVYGPFYAYINAYVQPAPDSDPEPTYVYCDWCGRRCTSRVETWYNGNCAHICRYCAREIGE